MKVKVHGNIVEVEGLIKTISDAQEVIEAIKSVNDNSIYIKIKDSFGLPSSIIGFLVKLQDEGKYISMEVSSEILYELLDDLNLIKTFNVRKV